MRNRALQQRPRLLPWYWVLGLVGCAVAVLVHIVAGAVIVCIAGALRSMAGYDLPSLDAVLGAIPAWKYFIGIYLVALAAVSLRYRGELSEWPVGPVALLLAWPFLVPAALIDLRAYKEDI